MFGDVMDGGVVDVAARLRANVPANVVVAATISKCCLKIVTITLQCVSGIYMISSDGLLVSFAQLHFQK